MFLNPMFKQVAIAASMLFALFACTTQPDIKNSSCTHEALQIPAIPSSLDFFNQQINLQDWDIKERLDRELLVNTYFQSSTCLALKRANKYFPAIEKILKEEGVPDDFKYLCVAESNLSNVVSPAGAAGFWQFMPGTAPSYGLIINDEIDERNNLEKSTRAACKLIKSNHALFNDWINACAAYNRGPGGLQQDMNSQGVHHFFDTELNPETARYVFRIMALKIILENPKAYGYNLGKTQIYLPISVKAVVVKQPINNLAVWAKKHKTSLKIVRLLNPWILGKQLTKKSVPCTIELPKNKNQLGLYK
jgi:hypothetical protein